MVKKCIVCGASFDRTLGISFHRFPKERVTRKRWLKACRATEKMIVSSSCCVCSRHFRSVDFDNGYSTKRRLRPNVVPFLSMHYRGPHSSFNHSDIIRSSPKDVLPNSVKHEMMDDFDETPIPESAFKISRPLKQEIKIIEVYSEATPGESVPNHNNYSQDSDEDVQVIEDSFEGRSKPKPNSSKPIKIIEVYSEAPKIFKYESDSDIEILEDPPERTSLQSVKGATLRALEHQSNKTEEALNINDLLDTSRNQSQYISNLTVEHFSTPLKAKRNLEFAKMTVNNLNKKIKKFSEENHRLLKKIERFKNVLLYLRNNDLILEENALVMIDKLL